VSQTCQRANFFAGRAGYPASRRKGVDDSFRFQGREVETKPVPAGSG
jgi:putative transposase